MNTFLHYRHATSLLEINGKKILIDPVFGNKGIYPPIQRSTNNRKNPLVDLPIDYHKINDIDGIIITHNHNDHFDIIAREVIDKDIPILCQNDDFEILSLNGFKNITAINKTTKWLGFFVKRFKGYHGGHIFKSKLGNSSSYLIECPDSKIYLTGDTLLTRKIKNILKNEEPNLIIANGGGARVKLLGKLTMDNNDIIKLRKYSKNSKIIVVHMDSINHCLDTRVKLKSKLKRKDFEIVIPMDGEKVTI